MGSWEAFRALHPPDDRPKPLLSLSIESSFAGSSLYTWLTVFLTRAFLFNDLRKFGYFCVCGLLASFTRLESEKAFCGFSCNDFGFSSGTWSASSCVYWVYVVSVLMTCWTTLVASLFCYCNLWWYTLMPAFGSYLIFWLFRLLSVLTELKVAVSCCRLFWSSLKTNAWHLWIRWLFWLATMPCGEKFLVFS